MLHTTIKDIIMITKKERLENFINSRKTSAVIAKIILASIAFAGVVSVVAIAPNMFSLLGKRRFNNRKIQSAFAGLKHRGFIEVLREKDGKEVVRITSKGETKIREFELDSLVIRKPWRWDKKWRIVIFDIPNRYRNARDALREKIKDLGFYQLQKSVWVYPYPCDEEVTFVANAFGVLPFVEILESKIILNEDKIKKFFDL